MVAIVVALLCIGIQVIVTDEKYKDTKLATKLILGRRKLYLGCIALVVFTGLYAVEWSTKIKLTIAIILCIGAVVLLFIKWDRATQVKTPLE